MTRNITESRQSAIGSLVADHFRCPDDVTDLTVIGDLSEEAGYFRFGDLTCYGRCSSGVPARAVSGILHDVSNLVSADGLPFDPIEVVNNLRYERYRCPAQNGMRALIARDICRRMYYLARPMLPVPVRKHLQKAYLRGWKQLPFPRWPVDQTVEGIFEHLMLLSMKARHLERVPFVWFWPDGAPSCTILTHDVETSNGVRYCSELMNLNDSFGIKSSFQIVPEGRYAVAPEFVTAIQERHFEVNIHDLVHDGNLFSDREEFRRRAIRINEHARQFGALGFRSAVMYRNAEWFDALEFSYDMSIPNVAHLDPQRGGCCTCMPFFVGDLVELPLTTTQDYSLFHILKDYSIDLWKKQIATIQSTHGLISFIVHPDYIGGDRERQVYRALLEYLCEIRAQGNTWIALPRDVAEWWRIRSKLSVVESGGNWRIEGPGKERARLAYAVIGDDQRIKYEVDAASRSVRG
jgi:hypothetical protein